MAFVKIRGVWGDYSVLLQITQKQILVPSTTTVLDISSLEQLTRPQEHVYSNRQVKVFFSISYEEGPE